ncbi:MAG TPA: hypothetical protein VIH76_16160 [Candidatus Acidoferrales bacterium]
MEQLQSFAANAREISNRYAETEAAQCIFEERLGAIAKHIDELQSSPLNVVKSADSPEACEPAVELRVKAEAARWMLRVAKHLAGPTRERVFTAVKKSLDEIESIVDSYTRSLASAPPRKARVAHAAAGR